jgi:hypothetical protein
VGVPYLPPLATTYSVLVGSGGGYSSISSAAVLGGFGAWPKAASDTFNCTGSSAGVAAVGVVGAFPTGSPAINSASPPGAFLPLAAAGAGGSGGEQFAGAAATADGTLSFAPSKGDGTCTGGSGFGGGTATAAAGGAVGCGACCGGPGASGAGTQLLFPSALAPGGRPFGCGGGGGGGAWGGGAGGWWMGGGAGSSSARALLGGSLRWLANATARAPGCGDCLPLLAP